MDPRTARHRLRRPPPPCWGGARLAREEGFLTVQFVMAVGLSLVLFTLAANLVVFQFGRGVVRAALDEGTRAGSRGGAGVAECQRRAEATVDGLLGGAMRAGVTVSCAADSERMVATGQATFPGWLPAVPDWSFTIRAEVMREDAP